MSQNKIIQLQNLQSVGALSSFNIIKYGFNLIEKEQFEEDLSEDIDDEEIESDDLQEVQTFSDFLIEEDLTLLAQDYFLDIEYIEEVENFDLSVQEEFSIDGPNGPIKILKFKNYSILD